MDYTSSGRKCLNWITQGTYTGTTEGIGNHEYCRNPGGSKERPWCFTQDPNVEWEYCDVPECANHGEEPVAWVAPAGTKSAAEEAKGPCVYVPPATPEFTEHMANQACMDNQGTKWWLITNHKFTVSAENA